MKSALQTRIALLRKGHSLRSWALEHGYPYSTVWRAAKRGGRRASSRRIAEHLQRVVSSSK
jgi:hypothetical protein